MVQVLYKYWTLLGFVFITHNHYHCNYFLIQLTTSISTSGITLKPCLEDVAVAGAAYAFDQKIILAHAASK
jgi:hypothetical protein